ncbi:helix-turn-helix domain-containing protein [Actinomadura sp. ATCC 31491]|uniref:Helix-turn-helix domain-containing protein n=1 Tax=Actinomadura luzonensis TaxID=2805427 RepID=A0ABT0G175_9ACTN|nr:helix-turn-helix domain-containing protein [Actinomadura luzonensis]MCK2218351.1 helix-turn-helix domain-containing protein [Actinomadura luzonensis]
MTIVPAQHRPAALAPFVTALSAYDLGPAGVHRGLPSSTLSITIPETDSLEVAWPGRPGSRERFRAVVAGLHLDAAELRQRGGTRGVWLTLSPPGAGALLGIPASALSGHVADLAEVAPALAHLPERLAACRSWPQRRALVEDALIAGRARHQDNGGGRDLRAALAALSEAARVQEAARLLGCSRRHLSGVVRAELGVTPKEYQRLLRFEAARGALAAAGRAGAADLAAVAAASGFADQAHFTREWRVMAGCTPTEWLRAETR